MNLSPELDLALKFASGLSWTLVYILIISRGFQDKTFGMPLTALCANLSWEFIFSFLHPHDPPQNYINLTWLLFDIVILVQALSFWQADFGARVSAKLFYPGFLLMLVLGFLAVYGVTVEFEDAVGKYSAFGQNLMMSALFIAMLIRRGNVNGQSMYIALLKMVGTLFASTLFFLDNPMSMLMNFLFVAIFTLDLVYAVLLYNKHRELRLNPWSRY